ncbi:MAG: Uma2 family endonuclease [Pseudomonadota bacterium]
MNVPQAIDTSNVPRRHLLTQQEYRLLDESGAFDRYAKTELIEGQVFAVNAQFAKHARTHTALFRALAAACDHRTDGLQAWIEASVALGEHSMPQPDIVVASSLPEKGPVPLDAISMVVEIADTSLDYDLTTKARLYAEAGVAEYWAVDVNARVIHQFWAPTGETFGERRETAFGEPIVAATIAGLSVETASL